MSSAWQRFMSGGADLTGAPADVTAAYCPVCSPVYAATPYQRYAAPVSLNNTYCRRGAAGGPDLDVFSAVHGPDLLGPLAPDTSRAPVPSPAALRVVSCSAPDLIELSSRLPQPQTEHAACGLDVLINETQSVDAHLTS